MADQGVTWVDVVGAVRAWARAQGLADERVFFAVNNHLATTLGQITVQRIGGRDDAAFMQFDVWGGSLETAATLAAELATALDGMRRYIHDGAVVLHGADVESSRWLPDEESDRPRYIVEATVTASAV